MKDKTTRQEDKKEQNISTSYLTSDSISGPISPTTIQRQRNVRVSTDREERAKSVGVSLSADAVKNMRSILDEISETGSSSKYDSDYDYDSETGIEKEIMSQRGRARASTNQRGREREGEGGLGSDRDGYNQMYISSVRRTDDVRESDWSQERGREKENYNDEDYNRISMFPPPSSSSSSSLMYSLQTPAMPPYPPPRHENNTPSGHGRTGLTEGGYLGQRNTIWKSVNSDRNSTEIEIEKNNDSSRKNNNIDDNIVKLGNIQYDNNDDIGLLRVAENEVLNLRESLKIEKKYNDSLQSQLSFSTNMNDSNMNSDSIVYNNQFTNNNDTIKINDGTFVDTIHDVRDDSNFSTNIGQKTYSTFMKETADEIFIPDGEGKKREEHRVE